MTTIQIVGAGSIGCFLAASFSLAGHDTTLIARGDRCARLHESGIVLARAGGPVRALPAIVDRCDGIACPDLAILCTKSAELVSAMQLLAGYADDPPVIVTVQNGVDAPEQVAACFPDATVLASRIHGFFEMQGTRVRHVGVEPSVHFGCWNADNPAAAEIFAGVLASSGIEHAVSCDIRNELWEKFMLASAIGGVGAALGIPAGQIMRNAEAREMLAAAMAEIARLASLRQIALPNDCFEATLQFVAGFPADVTSSLQRDLEARRPSEFNQLTGAVLRMAAEAELDVPMHRRIAQAITARGLL
jgi:2-dehydropantoate 2-reductase